MVAYEVTADVQPQRREEYTKFMRLDHIPAVLASGPFLSASFESSEKGLYRVRYIADSRDALDKYFAEFAPALRDDFNRRFPDGVELSREVWDVSEQFA
jgi:hypothetical protein